MTIENPMIDTNVSSLIGVLVTNKPPCSDSGGPFGLRGKYPVTVRISALKDVIRLYPAS